MQKRVLLIFVVTVFLCHYTWSQQNNNWYFGRGAGITFNSLPGKPIPSPLPKGPMIADEGSAAISDANGKLLFYTNGITVYNKNHAIMLNGEGLLGNLSSCQSSIIVPVPGNDSLFYIFTTDAIENSFASGYNYSIVNMRRNGGLGEVVTKNVLLASSCTERLTAARHRNGVDIWVITNDNSSNIFRAWLVSCNGLQPNAVVSIVGQVLNQHLLTNTGMMKISPDGTQLCQTHFPEFDGNAGSGNFFQLFDFDNSTGQLSNSRTIALPATKINSCEFSPDSRFLYLTRPAQKSVDQVECKLPSVANIISSRVTIDVAPFGYYGIQIAPDEKIYFSSEFGRFLGAVNKPNEKGLSCDFQKEQVPLNEFAAHLGLPACINDMAYSPTNGFDYTIIDSCAGIVQFNAYTSMPGTISWSWDFGDGNTSNVQNPLHTFNPSNGSYNVKIRISSSAGCGTVERSRIITPYNRSLTLSFDLVKRCDSGYVRFINMNMPLEPGDQFTWDFGDGNTSTDVNPIHSYNSNDTFIVKLTLTGATSCRSGTMKDTIVLMPFQMTVSPVQQVLLGQSVQLFADAVSDLPINYQWTPSTWLNNPSIPRPVASPLRDTTYVIFAKDQQGCTLEDSVEVKVIDPTEIFVPTGFTPNNDGLNDIIRPFYGTKFTLKEFAIFNRWGNKIFTTNVRGNGWNGKLKNVVQTSGVYVWIFKAVDETGKTIERKGSFVLIR